MVETGVGAKNIFRQIYQIQISGMHHQAHGYFELIDIETVGNKVLPNPLAMSALQKLAGSAQEVKKIHHGVISDMIAKEIVNSLTKTSLKKLGLC